MPSGPYIIGKESQTTIGIGPGGTMNATQLLAALNTVEQDHQLVLDKVQALKDAVSYLLSPEAADPRPLLDRLREFNKFFATQFASHLDEEETTLFPLLEMCQPGGVELVARLRNEHDVLRRRQEEFDGCLQVAFELEENLPRAVLRDVLTYGWALWELLDNHAHIETVAVHQCLAQALADTTSP